MGEGVFGGLRYASHPSSARRSWIPKFDAWMPAPRYSVNRSTRIQDAIFAFPVSRCETFFSESSWRGVQPVVDCVGLRARAERAADRSCSGETAAAKGHCRGRATAVHLECQDHVVLLTLPSLCVLCVYAVRYAVHYTTLLCARLDRH